MHDQADVEKLCVWMGWRALVENEATGNKMWMTPQHGIVLSTAFDPFAQSGDCAVVMAEAERKHVGWRLGYEGPWRHGPLYHCGIGDRVPVFSEESWMDAFCRAISAGLEGGWIE